VLASVENGCIFVSPNNETMTKAQQIESLTPAQNKLFKTLVSLGDSQELALKTVLSDCFNPELKKDNFAQYERAYCS
jgi:hypothetical protein